MRGGKSAICTALITLLAFSTIILNYQPSTTRAQATTTVYIDPELTVANVGATFSVNISVAYVTDLCSWQVYIYFKNEILEAIEYAEGPFLKSHGSTMFDGSFDNNYTATHGELWMYCLRGWTGYGVDGSGTLATVTFKAKLGGTSPLNLANTILGNSTAQRISHTTTDGNVQVLVTGIHDIAITNVNPLKTIVGQGYSMHINVTVENQGNLTETFNVTTYATTPVIQIQTATLESGAFTTLTFTWNTTGFVKGNYTISAYAIPVTGETDIINNNCTDGSVLITKVGDLGSRVGSTNKFFVCDGAVTSTDLNLFLQCYKATAPTDAMYLADLGSRVNVGGTYTNVFFVCDGAVTSTDLNLFLQCYKGQGPPDP